jgi:hypothetical protein
MVAVAALAALGALFSVCWFPTFPPGPSRRSVARRPFHGRPAKADQAENLSSGVPRLFERIVGRRAIVPAGRDYRIIFLRRFTSWAGKAARSAAPHSEVASRAVGKQAVVA